MRIYWHLLSTCASTIMASITTLVIVARTRIAYYDGQLFCDAALQQTLDGKTMRLDDDGEECMERAENVPEVVQSWLEHPCEYYVMDMPNSIRALVLRYNTKWRGAVPGMRVLKLNGASSYTGGFDDTIPSMTIHASELSTVDLQDQCVTQYIHVFVERCAEVRGCILAERIQGCFIADGLGKIRYRGALPPIVICDDDADEAEKQTHGYFSHIETY